MQFFDLLPVLTFLGLAALGIVVGFGLRILVQDAERRRYGEAQSWADRFTQLVGTLSNSAAIALALTLVADLLLVSFTQDARLLAGLTVLIATLTSFAAGFLRDLIRRVFYR